MKKAILMCLLVVCAATQADAQLVELRAYDGAFGGFHVAPAGRTVELWEETVMIEPEGPCTVQRIEIFFAGPQAGLDTIFFVGDPSEGALPPTSWAWSINTVIPPMVVNYNGVQGWRTFDVSDLGLRSDGYDRFVIQHRLGLNGPYFGVDNTPLQGPPFSSFIVDPKVNNSLGLPGAISLAAGDFMVRVFVEYDYPRDNGSQTPPEPSLVDVTQSAGLVGEDSAPLRSTRVSVADWNNDGWDDVAIGARFFENNGAGAFVNVSAELGISARATTWGDFDNDGNIDAYAVDRTGGEFTDKLYRNNGDGTFTDVTESAGLTNPYPTVTPIWFDYNRDSFLDIFIANGRTSDSQGAETYYPDQLWRNNGDGTFTNVTNAAGIAQGEPAPFYDCWGAAPCDYNNDGRPDIFVATYRLAPDRLYRNNGDGSFTEVSAQTGVIGVPTIDTRFYGHGIGCEWADYNNDGFVDLAVGNLGHPDARAVVSNPSLLFRNSGPPLYAFEEVHREAGIKFFEFNAGVVWLDLDLDGNLDLFHCQYGNGRAGQNGEPTRLSRMYMNSGPPDFTFTDRTWELGSLIHSTWTAVRLDYDRDGDVDIIAASSHENLKLFRNDVARNGVYLSLRLIGSPANDVPLDAYGSAVTVYADGRLFYRDIQGGGSGATASQNSNVLHFGLGAVTQIDSVVIRYPNGSKITRTDLEINREYVIPYDAGAVAVREPASTSGWSVANLGYADNAVHFEIHSTRALERLEAAVYNYRGERIFREALTQAVSGRRELALERNIADGVYIAYFTSGSHAIVKKFVVAP